MVEIVINANDRRIQYTATGGQTVFPYDFPIYVNTHLTVIRNRAGVLTTRTLTTDYTVSGVGAEGGGNVTLTAGATAGDVYTIYGSTPYERTSDYGTGGDFKAATLNKDFDWLTMLTQQNNRDLGRALRLHPADPATGLVLEIEDAADREDRVLVFNSTGDGMTTGPTVDDITTAVSSATAAAASESAAATSASNAATSATNASTSASTASTAATNASNSASAAATSETNAASSASAAATSATNASTSATNASNSASSASTSATNASNSASAAAASAVTAANLADALRGTSTTSNTIGTGSKNFATQANKNFDAGQWVTIVDQANLANYMHGQVTSYDNISDLFVDVTNTGGSGTISAWYIYVAGTRGATGAAGSVVDGTYNDITVTASGATWTIGNNKVTDAKFRQGAALSVVGVTGNATANVADIAAASDGQVLRRSGTTLAFGAVDLSVTAAVTGALRAGCFPALTGDVTTTAGSLTTAIAAGVIVNADINASAAIDLSKLATQAANSIVCNATAATAVPTAGVTLAASQLMGRGSTGNLAAIVLGTGLSMSGTTLSATGGAGLTQISTSTPGAVTLVDFTSIPATYNDLVLQWSGVSCATASRKFMVKPGIAGVFGGTNVHKDILIVAASSQELAGISFMSSASNTPLQAAASTNEGTLIIYNYASTAVFKRFELYQRYDVGGSPAIMTVRGWFTSLSAIDSLRMYWSATGSSEAESAVNFDAGTLTLYGRI